ncbi:MAG: hypothetical protein P8Y91_11895 [Desulfuromonadales bacterium]
MISCQRELFDIPQDVAYFNCAYTAPLLHSAVAAGKAALQAKTEPWTITSDHFFATMEENRRLFAELIGCDPACIAIIPAVSYGVALAAKNLPVEKGQAILLLQDQFPSHVYSFRPRLQPFPTATGPTAHCSTWSKSGQGVAKWVRLWWWMAPSLWAPCPFRLPPCSPTS